MTLPFRKIFFILLLLAFVFASVKKSSAQRFPFYNVNIENGLIQSQARDLAQDKMGHLWVATLGGLSRYDGTSFTNYTVRDGLVSNSLNAVAVDQQGKIWIGSDKGISKFDGKTFLHYQLQSSENPNGNQVTKIKIGDSNFVWCLSGNKLFSIHANKTQQLIPPENSTNITAFLPEKKTIWLAKRGVVYAFTNNKWDSILLVNKDLPFKPFITDIFRDSRNRLFITTGNGLYQIDSGKASVVKIKKEFLDKIPAIFSITESNDKCIWLGLVNGALKITDSTLFYFNKKNGLTNNSITSFLKDKEGNVWMATDGQGIFRFSGAQFTMLDETTGLPSVQVMSIAADKFGRIFLGTYDAGLYTFENGKVTSIPTPIKGKPAIYSLKFRKGILWIGTAGAGLWKYDGKNFFQFTTQNTNLPSNSISSLYLDNHERLWIGGLGGVSYLDGNHFHFINIKAAAIQDFISIGDDSILLATDNGLKLFHDSVVTPFITHKSPDSASLQCLTKNGNNLWIGTSNNGLIYYNLQSEKSFVLNKNNGLASDFIYNLTTDNEGNIWAGTGFGIHKITLQKNGKTIIEFFGKGQGILGMESNHGAVLKMHDGSIWFGTSNGVVHYSPEANIVTPTPTNIILQSIKVFGENITDSNYYDSTDVWYHVPIGLKLPYRKNTITFTFHALTLCGDDQIKYRYRIDGLDAPWSDWSNTNTITYSSLPPGKYVFRVQCITNGTAISNKELAYPFEIITPFHKTGWFRLIIILGCILLGVSIQYILNRRKQNRLKLVEQLRKEEQSKVRERTAEDFHDEVGNKLTRINVLTNVLKNKIAQPTPDTERIIQQIQDNAAQLYSGTRDILWSLKPSNDNLYEILHRIRDFGGELFQDTEVDFEFIGSDERWNNYKLPLDVSRNLIMIFKEALNNSLKYSKATKVKLEAHLKADDTLQMILSDNGNGFDIHYVKKGHGIDNMNTRATRIKGRLYIDSNKDKGTIITLTFKLIKELPSIRG